MKQSKVGRDCMEQAQHLLTSQYGFSTEELQAWETDTLKGINQSITTVKQEGGPDPYTHNWNPLATRELSEQSVDTNN